MLVLFFGNLEFPECHLCNVFDDDEDGKKTCPIENLDETLEFFKNVCQVPHDETETMKIKKN